MKLWNDLIHRGALAPRKSYRHAAAACALDRARSLVIEPLEERRILAAASVVAEPQAGETPWHNPAHRLDVNNDSVTNTSDLITIVNRILTQTSPDLPVPAPALVTTFYDTTGDNKVTGSDLLLVVNAILQAPTVDVSTLTTFTVDVTPHVTVKATPHGAAALPDGTVVLLDVDLNNDGDFVDPGEFGHSQSTLYQGESTFALETALPRSSEVYSIKMQARIKDSEAVFGRSAALPLVVDTLTSNALKDYVNTPDPSYKYSIKTQENVSIPFVGSYTYYAIDLTSQTWRSTDDVDKPVWRHWLTMYVPTSNLKSTAIMLIDGGSNNNFGTPPAKIDALGQTAVLLGTAFVHLSVVPNEPVIFTDETETRTEDEIIAYTMDQFLEHIGEPGNDTWPLLLPMVKSAVRAMDTAQAEVPTISDFMVTGYSKRGWTTWLTAAVDNRVSAIIPGVFDNLNQGPQMVHHYGAYGFFSEAVQPYNDMQIFNRILTPEAMQMSRIVDPYTYLANGRFDNMPKLLINSAGDEFFASDSAQFYFDDIPGDENYLLYLPNTGHGLDADLEDLDPTDSKVVTATVTFADAILNNRPLPKYSWTVGQDGAIHVETDSNPIAVKLWQATNPTERDFRHLFNPDIVWTSTTLNPTSPGEYLGDVTEPLNGATAYFVELTFANGSSSPIPLLKSPYVFTTEIHVKTALPLHDWPFEVGSPLVAAAGLENTDSASRNAIAAAIVMRSEQASEATAPAITALPSVAADAGDDVLSADASSLWLDDDADLTATAANPWDFEDTGDLVAEDLLDDCLAELWA
jgi:PhoPQ-activated pathogenicity-related protein